MLLMKKNLIAHLVSISYNHNIVCNIHYGDKVML